MATVDQWWQGARPRTLPAAISPVLAGTGAAAELGSASLPRAGLAAVVALALQIGVNYANDYSDGIRGTDAARVGPMRLVGSGAAPPRQVKLAAFGCFGLAALTGLVLTILSGLWWMILVGSLSILAAWFYTGGRKPYGYSGLGEVFVFVFFGLVAVLGTTGTQALRLSWGSLAAAVGVGALACSILVANNLRDIPTDTRHGKRTLAVRLGDRGTRVLYAALIAVAGVVVIPLVGGNPWVLLTFAATPLAVNPVRAVLLQHRTAGDLIPVLSATGRLELVYSALLGLGLAAG